MILEPSCFILGDVLDLRPDEFARFGRVRSVVLHVNRVTNPDMSQEIRIRSHNKAHSAG